MHDDRRIRRYFYKWRFKAKLKRERKNRDLMKAELEAALARTKTDYEVQLQKVIHSNSSGANISQVTNELKLAKQKIQEGEEDKLILQENLKKAFMRGVCALNLEAMSILKKTNNVETDFLNNMETSIQSSQNIGSPSDSQPVPREQQPIPNQIFNQQYTHARYKF